MIKQLIIIIAMATNVNMVVVIISIIKISLVAHYFLEIILNVFLLCHFQTSENILYSLLFYANFTIRNNFGLSSLVGHLLISHVTQDFTLTCDLCFLNGSRNALCLFLSTHHIQTEHFIKALACICVKIPLSESSQKNNTKTTLWSF